MKHFEHNGQKYLAVYVPSEWKPHSIKGSSIIVERPEYNNPKYRYVTIGDLPAGNYEIVGLVKIRV